MKKNKKTAFTLIELMIVIVIITLMMTLGYAPYNYYGQKAKVKIAGREIAQSIYEAKNLAISGRSFIETDGSGNTVDTNKSIGIVFEVGENVIKYYEFDYEENFDVTDTVNLSTNQNFKNKLLQDKVVINNIKINSKEPTKILLYFKAITGEIYIKDFNNSDASDSSENLIINFGIKDSTASGLKKNIKYFPVTNTTNYKN